MQHTIGLALRPCVVADGRRPSAKGEGTFAGGDVCLRDGQWRNPQSVTCADMGGGWGGSNPSTNWFSNVSVPGWVPEVGACLTLLKSGMKMRMQSEFGLNSPTDRLPHVADLSCCLCFGLACGDHILISWQSEHPLHGLPLSEI